MRLLESRLGPAALMALAAMGVHQLRYQLAFGERADRTIAEHGHGYLSAAGPLIALIAALALGLFLHRLGRAWRTGHADGRTRPPLGRLWMVASVGLIAIYAGQETLEGWLSHGHPGGLAGVFGSGGWIAVPSALVLGAVVALALRGAGAAIAFAAIRATRRTVRTLAPETPSWPSAPAPRPAPLATSAAGRAPPAPLPTLT